MRPVLKPGLSRIWHDENTLQLGHGPATSHRYRMTATVRALVDALDGTRDVEAFIGYGQRIGVQRVDTLELLDRLAGDGCLDDAALDTSALATLSNAERGRLDPDLSGLGLRHRLPGGAVRALERRRRAIVSVHGLGRIGAHAALRLAASGIGTVIPVDPSTVRAADTGPGSYTAADIGMRRQDALVRTMRPLAPSTGTIQPPHRGGPDLALLATAERPLAEPLSDLSRRGVPHLIVEVCEDRARLGPLVVPGRSPCTHCRDLADTDRDALHPRVLSHLGADSSTVRTACDTSLAAIAANHAVLHALAFLDGKAPPSLGAVIEFVLPYALPSRTTVCAHRACGCTGSAPAAGPNGLAQWPM